MDHNGSLASKAIGPTSGYGRETMLAIMKEGH